MISQTKNTIGTLLFLTCLYISPFSSQLNNKTQFNSLNQSLHNKLMQQKYCPKNNRISSINYSQDSRIEGNHFIITNENCLSLSNESDSLLVSSSLRASSSMADGSNMKKQNRLNSDFIVNQRIKSPSFSNPLESFIQQTKINKQRIPQLQSLGNTTTTSTNSCQSCLTQLPQLTQKLQTTTHRLQQMQALIKICFSKTMSLQNNLAQKDKQLLQIKTRLEDNQRLTKKNEQVLVKYSVNKGMEMEELTKAMGKLSERVSEKSKQVNDIVELEKCVLEQKIARVETLFDGRVGELISMVEQLAKTQDVFVQYEKQKQASPSNFDFGSSHDVPSINWSKRYLNSSQSKQRIPSSDKTRHQSKSKISYYLSKSKFNDTTTLGDTTIQQLSVLGGM